MSPRTRTRAKRGEGERTRTAILDATERLLVRKGGMDAVSIRRIADDVGVTPPAIYLHFADKDGLFFEVCRRRFLEFTDLMKRASEDATDPADRVERLGRAYVAYGLERPEHYEVLFVHKVAATVDVGDTQDLPGMEAFQLLVDAVAEGVARGVFRPADPLLAATDLWAHVHGIVTLVLMLRELGEVFPTPQSAALIDQAMTRTLHGLLA
ncbi:MAG TPA: TetR/AcrR family transcriptional regulator [Nitriliruptorales bacterium]|nr:TetR/AcrR family transcriptional regulator [Nitriliruptorales bacterium]